MSEKYDGGAGKALGTVTEGMLRAFFPPVGQRVAVILLETNDPSRQKGKINYGPLGKELKKGDVLSIEGENGFTTTAITDIDRDPSNLEFLVIKTGNSTYRMQRKISDDFKA